ncbi:MAG: hypothetical protein U5N53_02890 [Mycobacterium sp.]|nr:hypothetical protein [Mycobacterium sp.]
MSAPLATPTDPQGRSRPPATAQSRYFLPVALHSRLKAAWWATRDEPEGAPALAGLVEVAIGHEADRLEQLYNEGVPFQAAPTRAQGVNPKGASGYRHQTYYLPVALHARLKAAWWATKDKPEGAPALAGLVEVAFEREASHLGELYNEGVPFPPAPAKARGISRAAARNVKASGSAANGSAGGRRRPRPTPPTTDLTPASSGVLQGVCAAVCRRYAPRYCAIPARGLLLEIYPRGRGSSSIRQPCLRQNADRA